MIGMGLIWAGYTVGIWGYCLLNTYNIPFSKLFGADWPKPQNADVQQSNAPGGGGGPSAPKVRQIPPVQAF